MLIEMNAWYLGQISSSQISYAYGKYGNWNQFACGFKVAAVVFIEQIIKKKKKKIQTKMQNMYTINTLIYL